MISGNPSNIEAGSLNIGYFQFFALTIAGYGFTSKYAQHQKVLLRENLIDWVYANIADKVRKYNLLAYGNRTSK